MLEGVKQLAFIGPGGPEIIVVMLVLLLMFGAKDAPRIFRKLNEMLNQIRNTADGFKREIMYSDLNTSLPSMDEESCHNEDYDYDSDYYDEAKPVDEDVERDYSNETFVKLEKDLDKGLSAAESVDSETDHSETGDEDGDAQKN